MKALGDQIKYVIENSESALVEVVNGRNSVALAYIECARFACDEARKFLEHRLEREEANSEKSN